MGFEIIRQMFIGNESQFAMHIARDMDVAESVYIFFISVQPIFGVVDDRECEPVLD